MLRILNITAPDICNGSGCRITLWVAGCKHHCKGCQNEWTWNFNQGKIYKENKDEILNEITSWLDKPYIKGITLSGGDPLCQDNEGIDEMISLINYIRKNYPSKDIWMYTGYVYEEAIKDQHRKELIDLVDYLVDGPFILEKRDIVHYAFRGSENQRILNIKEMRENEKD